MQPTRLPRKKDVVLELLEHATVFVHLDPRAEAVRVPPWFKRQPQLVLQIGLNMAVPIPDLEVDDEGLSCTLSFNRAPFLCVIPWSSVFALVDDRRQGMVWPDDVPPELNQQAQQQPKPAAARAELKMAPAPTLAAVKDAEPAEAKEPKAAPKRRSRKTAAVKAEPRAAAAKPARAAKPRASAKAGAAKRVAAPEKAAVPKAAPAQAPAAAAGGASKRKLPPYLRVVK